MAGGTQVRQPNIPTYRTMTDQTEILRLNAYLNKETVDKGATYNGGWDEFKDELLARLKNPPKSEGRRKVIDLMEGKQIMISGIRNKKGSSVVVNTAPTQTVLSNFKNARTEYLKGFGGRLDEKLSQYKTFNDFVDDLSKRSGINKVFIKDQLNKLYYPRFRNLKSAEKRKQWKDQKVAHLRLIREARRLMEEMTLASQNKNYSRVAELNQEYAKVRKEIDKD